LGRLEQQTVYIKTGDIALKNKFFVAFISATLETNPLYQEQLKQNFELVRFKIIASEFSFTNAPPIISKFVEYLTIYANESMQVKVADLFDSEDKKTLSVAINASCPNNPSDWIKLLDA
jgi:hypothetical protein